MKPKTICVWLALCGALLSAGCGSHDNSSQAKPNDGKNAPAAATPSGLESPPNLPK